MCECCELLWLQQIEVDDNDVDEKDVEEKEFDLLQAIDRLVIRVKEFAGKTRETAKLLKQTQSRVSELERQLLHICFTTGRERTEK